MTRIRVGLRWRNVPCSSTLNWTFSLLHNQTTLMTVAFPLSSLHFRMLTISFFHFFPSPVETGMPRLCESQGLSQGVPVPVQCGSMGHLPQFLHPRWSLPCCAPRPHDLLQSDQPHVGVLCREEFPSDGSALLPTCGFDYGHA